MVALQYLLILLIIAGLACSSAASTPDNAVSLDFQPQQVFANKPGEGTITLKPLSGTSGENQTGNCVIEKQPESVNATVGSAVWFIVITSLECRHVHVFVSGTLVNVNKVQEENITIPEQFIGWRLQINYTITAVTQNISGIEVLFRALPDGTVVESSIALLLVQGIPGQVSNLTARWASSHQLEITCAPPPSLDNVQQWGTLYSELAPPKNFNECNISLSLNHTYYSLYEQYNVSVAWSNNAGEGPNMSRSVFLPGGIAIDTLNISKRSCGRQYVCLQVAGSMAIHCPGCKPRKIQLYRQLKSGKLIPIGQPRMVHVTKEFRFTVGGNLPLFRIKKHSRHDIVVEFSNIAGTTQKLIQSVYSYDVESVEISRRNGRGCISCTFLRNSSAKKCLAQIIEPSGQVFNITAVRPRLQARTANVCTERVLEQNTTVLVYDVDLNGHIVSGPAYFGSFPNSDPDPGINNFVVIGCVFAVVVVGAIIIGGVIIFIALVVKKKRSSASHSMDTSRSSDVELGSGNHCQEHPK